MRCCLFWLCPQTSRGVRARHLWYPGWCTHAYSYPVTINLLSQRTMKRKGEKMTSRFSSFLPLMHCELTKSFPFVTARIQRSELAVHKRSFLNLLRQNGGRAIKDYCFTPPPLPYLKLLICGSLCAEKKVCPLIPF